MPSWNEKPHVVPTINVNLTKCDCGFAGRVLIARNAAATNGAFSRLTVGHAPECAATPVLIPCPVPRSVTFSVLLGDCTCSSQTREAGYEAMRHWSGHRYTCPARPIRVACSISGQTWEESEVTDMEAAPQLGLDRLRLEAACRERWALVKALVLGRNWGDIPPIAAPTLVRTRIGAMYAQRDAVFAALADMAWAEEAALTAQQRVDDAFPFARYRRNDADHRSERPSVGRLAAYVEHLIEQVGVLP